MSYSNLVLQDYPLAFYHLDEVASGSTSSYTILKNKYATYQDVKNSVSSYSALSGLPIYDTSGNSNDGFAIGASSKVLMPLVAGGVRGTEILSSTTISFNTNGIATKYYADNSFTIEFWLKPCKPSSSKINLVGDLNTGIGLFYQNGDIILSNGIDIVRYKIPFTKVCYVIGVITNKYLSLYIDGIFVNSVSITNYFKFTNDSCQFNAGPAPTGDTFMIDDVAFYRYELSQSQIIKHYNEGIQEIPASQIVGFDSGYLFTLNHSSISSVYSYSYPKNKSWSQLVGNNAITSSDQSYVTFQKTIDAGTASFSFTDEIIIPSSLGVTTSQISYEPDISNILIEASNDGVTWKTCYNNSPIPFFNKNDNSITNILHLRVTMSSSDTRTDLPILKNIYIDFFKNKDFYSDNSSYKIYSDKDYGLGRYNSRILSYDQYNGIKPYNGYKLLCNIDKPIKTIELIYSTDGLKNTLFSTNNASYSWNDSGVISKSGISAVYINNIDVTSATNIFSVLSLNTPNHVVFVLNSNASSLIFNSNQDGTSYGANDLYNNIALYSTAFSSSQVNTHFLLYTNNLVSSITGQSISISESSANLLGVTNNTAPYYLNELNWLSSSI